MEEGHAPENSGAALPEDAVVDPDVKHVAEASDSSDTSSASSADAVPVKELAVEQIEVPVGQTENSADEHVEPAKEVESFGDLGPVLHTAEVPLEEEVKHDHEDIIEPSVDKSISEPEEIVPVEGSSVPVEAVETLSLTETGPGENTEKDLNMSVASAEQTPESFDPREQLPESTEQVLNDWSRETPNQVQDAVSPPIPRRTSWLSCCGLFDVFFGGSNR